MITAFGRQRLTQRLVCTIHHNVARKFRIAGRVANFSNGPSNSWDALEDQSSRYAVVDHARAYEDAMRGRHGNQLDLAQIHGVGRDDLPYDPFQDLEEGAMVDEYFNQIAVDYDDGDSDAVDPVETKEKKVKEVFPEAEILSETTNQEKQERSEDEELDEDEEDEALDYIDDVADELTMYNNDGSPKYSKMQLANFRAGYPAGGLFAVIRISGSQNKVTIDDVVVLNRLKPQHMWPIGSIHTIKDVLLVGSSHKTLIGMPNVAGAEVDVMIEEITRDEKVVVFKKRRRKNSQRKNGFRRDVSLLRVLDIRFPKGEHDHRHAERVKVKPSVTGLS